MKRRSRGKSALKQTRLSPSPKRTATCSFCRPKASNAPVIAHGLYRKHSWTQSHHYLQLFHSECSKGQEDTSTAESEEEEYLGRYYKTASRRQVMSKLKSVYGLHREIPRLFQPEIRDILEKCHHRKRLLEYFRIAKSMGIRVESVDFSSFLLSGNLLQRRVEGFEPILGGVSGISEELASD